MPEIRFNYANTKTSKMTPPTPFIFGTEKVADSWKKNLRNKFGSHTVGSSSNRIHDKIINKPTAVCRSSACLTIVQSQSQRMLCSAIVSVGAREMMMAIRCTSSSSSVTSGNSTTFCARHSILDDATLERTIVERDAYHHHRLWTGSRTHNAS